MQQSRYNLDFDQQDFGGEHQPDDGCYGYPDGRDYEDFSSFSI